MTIYPTVLYIKQHSVTGLKYFGKTSGKDPYTYNGSGKHWKFHIKKHGKEHIVTLWVSESYTDSEMISEYALAFSKDNNIVESKEWANLVEENGLDGGMTPTDKTRAAISASLIGKPKSDKTRANMSAAQRGRTHSEETKAKISAAGMGKLNSKYKSKYKISDALTS